MGMIDDDYIESYKKSYSIENKEILLDTIMKQLGITKSDLENDPSWIKAKIRESKINEILK